MELQLVFFVSNRERIQNELQNNEIYAIRRRIAQMFEDSEYGFVLEEDGDKFSNERIRPVLDDINQPFHELVESFVFRQPFDRTGGNLSVLLLQQIPILFDWVNVHYPHLHILSRLYYLPNNDGADLNI